jgi:RimK family alpha-L-glutamate ligase
MRFAALVSSDSWYLRDLKRAAGSAHEVVPATFEELTSLLGDGRTGIRSGPHDLCDFDAVIVRTMPPGSLEQVVFRMDLLGRLEAGGTPVVNPPRAIEAAVDKYLTTAKLQHAGLPVPKTVVCQTVDEAMTAFEQLGQDVVLKPIFGGEGRGITRLSDEALALRAFSMLTQLGSVIYMQQFIDHEGFDDRVLIVGQHALAIRRRSARDWRTNVSRGARAEAVDLDSESIDMAKHAAAIVGAPIAGVDLLTGRDGRKYLLEVNGVPGWKALAGTLKVDVAKLVIDYIASII